MKKETSTRLKKTSIAALTRILKGNSNPYGNEGFYFTDTITGKMGITDSYCAVMYDNAIEIDSEFRQREANVTKLFEPFNNEFHEWYSDDRMENISVKEIIELNKAAKKRRSEDDLWYYAKNFDVNFNINLMRDVCEALDCKTVGIYYPYRPAGTNVYKPIVIIGENGMGLVMPIR